MHSTPFNSGFSILMLKLLMLNISEESGLSNLLPIFFYFLFISFRLFSPCLSSCFDSRHVMLCQTPTVYFFLTGHKLYLLLFFSLLKQTHTFDSICRLYS